MRKRRGYREAIVANAITVKTIAVAITVAAVGTLAVAAIGAIAVLEEVVGHAQAFFFFLFWLFLLSCWDWEKRDGRRDKVGIFLVELLRLGEKRRIYINLHITRLV